MFKLQVAFFEVMHNFFLPDNKLSFYFLLTSCVDGSSTTAYQHTVKAAHRCGNS